MAEIKTKATNVSVKKFIDAVDDEQKKKDSHVLVKMMEKITGEKPKMWGPSIIGFGKYEYRYESGHGGEMCVAGFSPRKAAITIYILMGFEKTPELLKKLGKHKVSKACLYIKRLSDIDLKVLEELVKMSVKEIKSYKVYPNRAE
ncbi:MAG TPA: DUF1801 domain-containing protein [Ignavibacteria bacterium]|nr:hypothetical protein [Bacteroidota bacterium]HRE09891.1 DUF1801 domain-containing protein [Ignavibacteria bacterium]HRF66419.1 DUF1801 domain-containing protein [Ignavibacteria bacterium]HRJ05606.1 DUF1801 domain-containing protein [Ignavibacteria bacterium]HRJ85404.1 DUF1801 domain-containing protein [Ignavibacteria bacterium]